MPKDLTEKYNNNEIVKLEMTDNYQKNKHTDSYAYLGLWKRCISQDEMNTLAHLAELLPKVGINLSVKHINNENLISFSIDFETFNKKITRGAGPKKNYHKDEKYKPCTVAELKAKIDNGMKNSQIIRELGCPTSTFYRIMNNLKKLDLSCDYIQDNSIWDYTS